MQRLVQEDILGPVLCVMVSNGEEKAAQLENATRFGLASGIWTRHGTR